MRTIRDRRITDSRYPAKMPNGIIEHDLNGSCVSLVKVPRRILSWKFVLVTRSPDYKS